MTPDLKPMLWLLVVMQVILLLVEAFLHMFGTYTIGLLSLGILLLGIKFS